jgi:hypothetical protein
MTAINNPYRWTLHGKNIHSITSSTSFHLDKERGPFSETFQQKGIILPPNCGQRTLTGGGQQEELNTGT